MKLVVDNVDTYQDDPMKTYTLYTRAPSEVVSEIVHRIAMRHGTVAYLNALPEGAVVTVPRRVWTASRWWAVFISLFAAPILLPWPAVQGYGLGWMVAAIVLLANRRALDVRPKKEEPPC